MDDSTIDHPAPANGSPTDLPYSEATARMADGTLLRTLHWPAVGEPWAEALLVHGLGEHARRHGTEAEALIARGIDVRAYDHRGFGRSAGPRAWVERWSQFHDDLEERVRAIRAERPDLPLILWGHSMGGLIAAGYVLSPEPRPLPDLLVLSSPGLTMEVPGWKRALVGGLAGVLPRLRVSTGVAGEGFSHDPAIREAYAADPLRVGSSTLRFAHEGFREQERVQAVIAGLEAMPMPTYVFHGSEDPVVPVSATASLGTLANVTRHVHDGLYHETCHEPEHDAVLAEAIAWLEAQRAGLARDATTPVAATGSMVAPV